jgi:hypothetical protein
MPRAIWNLGSWYADPFPDLQTGHRSNREAVVQTKYWQYRRSSGLFRLLAFCLFAIVSEEDTASIVSTERTAFSLSHSASIFLSGALDVDRSCLTGHGSPPLPRSMALIGQSPSSDPSTYLHSSFQPWWWWPLLVLKRWQTSKILDGATTGKVKITAFWYWHVSEEVTAFICRRK